MARRSTTVAAVLAFTLAAAACFWLWRPHPFRNLLRSVPTDVRFFEPRLTGGFPWAPFNRDTRRGAVTNATREKIALASAAWHVLAQAQKDGSPESQHAAAVALIFAGKKRESLRRLEELAAGPAADPRVWSDLAALRCDLAVVENDPELLAEALAAADLALRADPEFPEALFNRALIIERLGLRDQARKAWSRHIAAEPGSKWAIEAGERARTLDRLEPFQELLNKRGYALARDAAAARQVVLMNPQEARRWGETAILQEWATAESNGDRATAERNLRIARAFGGELARTRGESMLEGAVAAIDAADDTGRRHLIRGQMLLREAQNDFKADRASVAQPKFAAAARELAHGGSPLSLLASFYLAHTFHAVGDLPEARRRELNLLTSAPPHFPAHRAHLQWHLGLGYMSDGDWGNATAALMESGAVFSRLGEAEFAATVHGLLAEVYDRIGDPQSAWTHRVIALRGIGRRTTPRLQQSLDSIGRGAILRQQWNVAVSFLDLSSEVAAEINRPVVEVETRLLQAQAYAEVRNMKAARNAIARARMAAIRLDDAAKREEAEADIIATEALVTRSDAEAIELLTRAIRYHEERGRRIRLPAMYLQRGKAYARGGRTQDAAADFETGIAEVERHRDALPAGSSRWGAFDPSRELFDSAVALAVANGDAAAGLSYAERARARELLDALGSPRARFSHATLRADVALVEYVSLPDELIIFVVDHSGVRAVSQRLPRALLESEARKFAVALTRSDIDVDVHRTGNALYRRLISPIAQHLNGKRCIVFVGDAAVTGIPFAALSDGRGEFLIERYAVVISPSAAVYEQLSLRKRRVGTFSEVLVVSNPAGSGREALPAAEREGNDVAGMYPLATRLERQRATVDAFRDAAPRAHAMHIATHGVGRGDDRGDAALLFAGGRLDVRTIALTSMPNTNVVVLAACDSGGGRWRSEGTISVARAFLAAGVPAVLATVRPIDDSGAADFFPRIHRSLVCGLSPAEALRVAQVEAIRAGRTTAVWTAVQCYGS